MNASDLRNRKLDRETRLRMAADRQETLDTERYLSHRERTETEAEIRLLLAFGTAVGFDGNDVIRL